MDPGIVIAVVEGASNAVRKDWGATGCAHAALTNLMAVALVGIIAGSAIADGCMNGAKVVVA